MHCLCFIIPCKDTCAAHLGVILGKNMGLQHSLLGEAARWAATWLPALRAVRWASQEENLPDALNAIHTAEGPVPSQGLPVPPGAVTASSCSCWAQAYSPHGKTRTSCPVAFWPASPPPTACQSQTFLAAPVSLDWANRPKIFPKS